MINCSVMGVILVSNQHDTYLFAKDHPMLNHILNSISQFGLVVLEKCAVMNQVS